MGTLVLHGSSHASLPLQRLTYLPDYLIDIHYWFSHKPFSFHQH